MLGTLVREAARRFGDAPALVTPEGWTVSYRELDRLSDEAGAGLAARGARPGDVCALLLPSRPDYVVAYIAAAKCGAATAGVNMRLAPGERERILQVAAPRVVLGPDEVEPADRPDAILATVRKRGGVPDPVPDDPDRPVAICFTSGTTGEPKGAEFTGRQLRAIAEMDIGGRWGEPGTQVPMLASTEFVHVGFMTKLAWHLMAGMRIHMLGRWRASDALDVIERERILSVGGIPAQIALMLREPGFDDRDLECVKTIVVGGAASSAALIAEARERFGAAYSVRYSSTESGGLGTMTPFDAPDEEVLETVGRPRPGIDLEIRDSDGRPLPAGEVGEICLRSPAMMTRYVNAPGATSRALRDGWLHTGDLGSLDEQGLLRLAGRTSEMFIRGGYNVHPQEVEAVLAAHPRVREVVVVPRPDPVMGEIGVAVVVPRDRDHPPSLDDLRDFASTTLAHYKLPEALRLVDELPFTSMHKVDRRMLKHLLGSSGGG